MLEYIFIDQKAIGSVPTILLSMSRASDRRLLKKNIPDQYTVIEEPNTSPAELKYDLCIADLHSFKKYRTEFLEKKERALPAFLPLVLLVENNNALKYDPEVWTQVDDIIQMPVPINMLNMRINNQIRSRRNSLQIARQNEKLHVLEKAVHSTDIGIVISDAKDEDNRIIFANKGFSRLTGYSKAEILGQNCRFLQNNDNDQEALKDVRSLINSGVSGRSIIRNYKKDGTLFWNELSIAPVKDSTGSITHFIGIQNDVTKLVETQQKLKVEKNHHKVITENSIDMISRHNLDGKFLYATPSSQQLVGYSPLELSEINVNELYHPEDREKIIEAHKDILDGKHPAQVTYRIKTKSGDYKWVETISRLSLNIESDYILELQSTTRDISQRKEYEKKLEDSVNEKSVLLQEIHHRVKNNLAVISGLLQIQQFDSKDEQLNRILGNSVSRIKSMALIHEKLYRSKSLSHLEFREYVEDLVSSIKKTQDYSDKINIHINCDDIILNVNQAVPCALILNETISNAIEHAFVNRDKGTIWVSFKEKDDQILASVKDNGIGIPNDLLDRKRQSMGLTIIQTLIKQLSSKLEVKTENGTEFSFPFHKQDVKGAHSRFV